jgi:hypothetical protein
MAGPKIPTTKELTEQNVANYESKINQTVPLTPQAFARVISAAQSMSGTGLFKYGADRTKENLAITASIEGLSNIGREHGVFQKQAQACNLRIQLEASPATEVDATNKFTGDANGEEYTPDASGQEDGGFIELSVTADDPGTQGNLSVDDTLTIRTQVPGVSRSAVVIEVVKLGTNLEETETYRARVLFEIRTQGGGGNAADFKRWAELVPGVKRAYPYSGRPLSQGTLQPIERSVFVEAQEALAVDGIAPPELLADVRESITRNAESSKTNQPLGLTDETLFVVSIFRSEFFVEIRGFDVEASKIFQAKLDIETELERYFRSLFPFVDSVDPPVDQNNKITTLTVSTTVQDILNTVGGTATSIGVGQFEGVFFSFFTLNQGQLAKLGSVNYA